MKRIALLFSIFAIGVIAAPEAYAAFSFNSIYIDSTSQDSSVVYIDFSGALSGPLWVRWGENQNLSSQEDAQTATGSGQLTFTLYPSKDGTKHYLKAYYWDSTLTTPVTSSMYTFTTPGSPYSTTVTLLPGNSGAGGELLLDFRVTTNDSNLQVWAAYERGTTLTSLAQSTDKINTGIVTNEDMQISITDIGDTVDVVYAAAILYSGSDIVVGSTDTVTYNVTTSIYELSGKKVRVTVYPNPVEREGTIYISSNAIKGGNFYLFDLTGRKIDVVRIEKEVKKFEYKISGLPPGIYPYQIETKKGDKAGKFIIR